MRVHVSFAQIEFPKLKLKPSSVESELLIFSLSLRWKPKIALSAKSSACNKKLATSSCWNDFGYKFGLTTVANVVRLLKTSFKHRVGDLLEHLLEIVCSSIYF